MLDKQCTSHVSSLSCSDSGFSLLQIKSLVKFSIKLKHFLYTSGCSPRSNSRIFLTFMGTDTFFYSTTCSLKCKIGSEFCDEGHALYFKIVGLGVPGSECVDGLSRGVQTFMSQWLSSVQRRRWALLCKSDDRGWQTSA